MRIYFYTHNNRLDVCMQIYVHIHLQRLPGLQGLTYLPTYLPASLPAYIHTSIHTHTYTLHIYADADADADADTHTHTRTHTHTQIYRYIYIYIFLSGLHLKTCTPTWQQSWVVAFMHTVHRKQRCYCHGSPLRQLVWIAGTCLVEFPTKSRGCGVWVVGFTKYAFFGFLPYRAIR